VIKDNHCGCSDASKGLEAKKNCKCAFAQNGTLPDGYSKRDTSDESREIFEEVLDRVAKTFPGMRVIGLVEY
jgi:hypothetical protein